MNCRIVHGRQLTDAFEVRIGVRQGFPVPDDHRLCYEDLDGSEVERNSVNTLETVGRPRLCG
ncbi:hypothetical protein DPMN_044919 [Dreissena polymorpha]|uniref:Uncharacterized protein n=1 Tax=Dreissena polymorpha TaxID=45954 RepID=A0A9D4D348_DREPO|nr:hypothetical protein DPMN_044919 [Dreissena polymorpha]